LICLPFDVALRTKAQSGGGAEGAQTLPQQSECWCLFS